ncbi:MAG TPA: iron-containing alcohol dehydrogenase [Bacteroidales bacterium]|nr:iron-containing alcohol dehydrogenase [Bacteroidales bacterium]
MQKFIFHPGPALKFGNGESSALANIIKPWGDKFILVTGSQSFVNLPYYQQWLTNFAAIGLIYKHIIVKGEPRAAFINEQCRMLRNNDYKFVVAIGGGSVMDAAKAIAAMVTVDNDIENYLEGLPQYKQHPGTTLPLIALPTTAGTGSEATKNAVISNPGINGFKSSLRHDNFIPRLAIIDPSLHVPCPANVTAASGLDALTQLIEAYTSTQANTMTDTLAIEGISLCVRSLKKAALSGDNIEARSDMALAAYLSGVVLANAGLGVVHGFASSVASMFDIPHGVICGTLLGESTRMNIKKAKILNNIIALSKFTNIGKVFATESNKDDNWYLDFLVQQLNKLIDEFNIQKLGAYQVTSNDLQAISKLTKIKNNPVTLTQEEILEIITSRT